MANNRFVLIAGESANGKSASLRNLRNQEGVVYLNTEANKPLPFKNKFKEIKVTNPKTLFDAFVQAESKPEIHTIVIDSLTYWLDMLESYVKKATEDKFKVWDLYGENIRKLFLQYVGNSTKNIIFIAHNLDLYDDSGRLLKTSVTVKGSLKNNGLESFFTTVIYAKKIRLDDLPSNLNPEYFKITDTEKAIGYKYVFQTLSDVTTINSRIRSPMGMFNVDTMYIDNDAQVLLDILTDFYGESVEETETVN